MRTAGWIALAWLCATFAHAAEFDHTHARLDRVLKTYVKNERVDYAALKASPQDLDAWLKSAGAVTEADFNR